MRCTARFGGTALPSCIWRVAGCRLRAIAFTMQRHPWEAGQGGYGGSEAGYGGVPSYPYKGSGLLDDDPKGLR